MTALSPIARKQRALYGVDHGLFIGPADVLQRVHLRAGPRLGCAPRQLGYFGITGSQGVTGVKTGVAAAGTTAAVGSAVAAGVTAAGGAAAGAAIGSVVPIIGTAIGAIVGLLASGILNRQDQEVQNFNQAVAIWQQNRLAALNIANKYLVLAGLFDLTSNQIKGNIPIYRRYGRMGEQRFVEDMMLLIHDAALQGKITARDTPATIMANVVQPWIDSWGFGPMADAHADLINLMLMGMIAEYAANLQTRWVARGGDYPFGNLPKFILPTPASAAPLPSAPPTTSPAASSPVFVPAPAAVMSGPPVPTNLLSTDGSAATPGSNTGLKTPTGTVFYFGPTATASGDFPIYVNGAMSPVAAIGLVLLRGGHVYAKNMLGQWYVWTGAINWSPSADPTVAQQLPSASISTTTVPIPTGFSVSGTDAATGLPIYSTVNGGYFSWNGATMTPFTGTLTSGLVIQGGGVLASTGTPAPVASNLPSLNTGSQQLYNSSLPPVSAPVDLSALSPPPVGMPSAPPASIAPTTAGVSGAGLPSWMTWGAIAGVAVLMFATARPHGKLPAPRRRGAP